MTNSQTGEPVPNAGVEIINQQTGLVINKTTSAQGRFFQGLLIPGIYTIRVSAPGFDAKEVEQRLLIARSGEVVPVPVVLDPSGAPAGPTPTPTLNRLADTDVRAEAVALDTQRGGSFPVGKVDALPLGSATITRSFDELTLLLPGVAPPPPSLGNGTGPGQGAGVGSAGQFAVNGLRSRGNNFTVDGSDNNDEDIGVRRQGFLSLIAQPIEAVQEYQAITLLAPAQFGRNFGAQVNAVSKSGGSALHGTVYGFFNASQLNARNFFDSADGNATTPLVANGRPVTFRPSPCVPTAGGSFTCAQGAGPGTPQTVTNQSGGEDSLTSLFGGFAIGGPLKKSADGLNLFFFVSAEGQRVNATQEGNFAVPTIAQRGLFGSGASGISSFLNPITGALLTNFSGQPLDSVPNSGQGDTVFSLFPFPNHPSGLYGPNTFTQILPANAKGKVFSLKFNGDFKVGRRVQSAAARYNLTDDFRDLPVTGGAIFSSLRPRVLTQNLSLFLNSELPAGLFNHLRASYGRTRLNFKELRDTQFLIPSVFGTSVRPEDRQFLLNAPNRYNDTRFNSSAVIYSTSGATEDILGPVGQIKVAGFSPLGVDVFDFPQKRVNNTYQLADDLAWQTGAHRLTFGADTRRTELNSELNRNSRVLFTFNGVPRIVGSGSSSGFYQPTDLVSIAAAGGAFQTLTRSGPGLNLRFYQYNFYGQDEWRVKTNLALSYGLRYEYNTPPREVNNRLESAFTDPAINLAPDLRAFIAGRTKIFDSDRNNFAPRLGLAFAPRLFGAERVSVVRAGYGMYFDQVPGTVISQARNVFPNALTLNLIDGNAAPLRSIPDPSPTMIEETGGGVIVIITVAECGPRPVSIRQPGTINQLNPSLSIACLAAYSNRLFGRFSTTLPARRLSSPTAQHYTASWEQQVARNTFVSMGYVGTQGRHLLRLTTPNLGPNKLLVPIAFFFSDPNVTVGFAQTNQPLVISRTLLPGQGLSATGGRPLPGVGEVEIYEASANSAYHSLQVQLRGRYGAGLQAQAAYTYSRAMDDVSDVFDVAGAPALPQNSLTRAGERGRANFDAPHRLTYNFIYDFPRQPKNAFRRFVFNGLQISSAGAFRSGQPFTVGSIYDVNLDGNLTDRPDRTDGLAVTGNRRQPLRLTVADPTMLLAPVGQNGRVGRNTFRAGSVMSVDLAVSKRFLFTNGHGLTARADIFNLTNRANFGIPVRLLGATGFGQATDTLTPARRVQIALKYLF